MNKTFIIEGLKKNKKLVILNAVAVAVGFTVLALTKKGDETEAETDEEGINPGEFDSAENVEYHEETTNEE